MNRPGKKIRVGIFLNVSIGIVFIVAAAIVVMAVNSSMHQQALLEAQSKARLILDRNLAVHTYFSHLMKPSIFAWSEPFRKKEYFDPAWMSSTYALREIEKFFKSLNPSGYSFKDAALNARSPENEADEYERDFIENLKVDKKLESESRVRKIGGKPYLVVLRKGEVLEASCLRCHSNPQEAPKGLTDSYGSERSFHRKAGDVISAVSLRIPLSEAYGAANIFSLKLSALLLTGLIGLFIIQYWVYRRYLLKPLKVIQEKALQIANHEEHLGEQIPQLFGRELNELSTAFNELSMKLRQDRDLLEETVEYRTEALRQEKEFAENLIETAQMIILILNPEGKILRFNPYMEKISGYSIDEVIGKDWFETFLPERDREDLQELFLKAVGDIQTRGNVNPIVSKGGEERFIEWYDKTIKNAQGSVIGLISIGQDITERKLAEEKIKASLLEKETILKEIHHRVKNNLAVISSLLGLQSRYLQDEKSREMFQKSQDRVRVMANIHTLLYQSEDLSRVDFGGFIRDLAGRLQQSYKTATSPIEIQVDIADVSLAIETSIPCGLVLNELVSNALKHAFPEELFKVQSSKFEVREPGTITITLREQDQENLNKDSEPRTLNVEHRTLGKQVVLTVQDNGIGFPEAVDFQNTKSLGLELVNLLVGQINGKINMQVEGGTIWTITFPVKSERE